MEPGTQSAASESLAPSAQNGPAPGTSALVLLFGVLAMSSSSLMIRLADAPALAVGAWRMVLATALLLPFAWRRSLPQWKAMSGDDWLRMALSGLALGIHFGTWITSLSFTTVASSVILVSTTPLWVALATRFLLKEPVGRGKAMALSVALVGTVVVSWGDLSLSGQALWGDLLALTGAWAGSAYVMLGKGLRAKLDTLSYVTVCYGIAGISLVTMALVGGVSLVGYGWPTMGLFLLMALGPQILGHSSINWGLRHFSSVMLTVVLLGEPVGAMFLALLFLNESPPWGALVGGVLILAGIYMASRVERKETEQENEGS